MAHFLIGCNISLFNYILSFLRRRKKNTHKEQYNSRIGHLLKDNFVKQNQKMSKERAEKCLNILLLEDNYVT